MSDPNTKLNDFFSGYEAANAKFDVERIAACYGDVFMFGGPDGVQSIKKQDFLRALPRRKEFFRSVGLVSSKLESFTTSILDSKYLLVKAVWNMRFERSGSEAIQSQNSASYVLFSRDDRYEIVCQIDHQDLRSRVQEL